VAIDRRQRVESLVPAALARPAGERAAFIADACGDDNALRDEVLSLVSGAGPDSAFLKTPAIAQHSALTAGSRVGPYEVIERIGAGGMGEVYRARDTRLGREVAIKTLPHDRLTDESRRRQFIREARAASALNHPNIVTIHEIESIDGVDVIVMELVTGRTLGDAMRQRLKVGDALRIAIQIADALARAHAAGIVHRDLKPGNVMIGAGGQVKLLDFGLAKLVDPERPRDAAVAAAAPSSPTITVPGVVAGTPAYMSPEQAVGAEVDVRSDIFSFGAVLYEMVAGRRAFAAETVSGTLEAVVHAEPAAPATLVPGLPPELERLILRCLRKDPSRRMQHMADVKIELVDLEADVAARPATIARGPTARGAWAWPVAAIAAVLVVTAMVWMAYSSRRAAAAPVRLVPVTTVAGNESTPALSPDGESVAFSWEGEPHGEVTGRPRHVWITLIGASELRQLTSGAESDFAPSWSPDGKQIAFVRGNYASGRGVVHLVSPLGGPPRALDASIPVYSQLSWSADGRWIAASGYRVVKDPSSKAGGLQLIPVDGGTPRPLTTPRGLGYDAFPAFTSDGRRLAYSSCTREVTPPCDVFVIDLGSDLQQKGPARQMTRVDAPIHGVAWASDERSIVFAPSTMSIYGSGIGVQLWRVAVSGGTPERIDTVPWGSFAPNVNRKSGRLVFAHDTADFDIFRYDPSRPPQPIVASSFVDYAPSFSPDGRRIAFESSRSGSRRDIWVSDPDGSNAFKVTQATPDPQGTGTFNTDGNPNWNPDGSRIVFTSLRNNSDGDIFTVNVDGTGRRAVTNDHVVAALPFWSHDGRWIYYRQDRPGGREIVRVSANGGTPEPLTKGGGLYPIESWDGKTLFFTKPAPSTALYAMPSGGGDERRVIDCVQARALAVTPPNVLYYLGCAPGIAPVALHRRDLNTGRDDVVGTIAQGSLPGFLGLAVSPDGKTILYARVSGDGSDVMMLENFR